jgi:ribosome-associated protein
MNKDYSREMAGRIAELAVSKKAKDVRLLNLENLTDVADYFVICHGDSDVQVKAITEAVVDGMKDDGFSVWHKEGYAYLRWVLLDYVDVVVHVFEKETREFYGLERIWGDAKTEAIEDK